MTKNDLLSQLENVKNNFILVLASTVLLSDKRMQPILSEYHCIWGENHIDFKQVSSMMEKESDRNIALNEFIKSGLRNLIKETFELIKDYSICTDQTKIFQKQNWYHFSELI
jgi:hypothetical protein